jgi:hypothetical protein
MRFDGTMAPRFLTILTGLNLPKIRQSREPEPSIINEKTVAGFTRVVEFAATAAGAGIAAIVQALSFRLSG